MEGIAVMNNNRVKSLEVVVGDFKFRLLGMSEPLKISNQILLIESKNLTNGRDMPVKFAVYRSVSQNIWRLAIIEYDGQINKFSDYTCTTQIHPDLQAYIESVYDKILILSPESINIQMYNYAYYYKLINNHEINHNNNMNNAVKPEISKYFDSDRLLEDSNFELLSCGLFNQMVPIDNTYIRDIIKSPLMFVHTWKYYANFPADVEKYFPKDKYGAIKVSDRLQIMAKYLSDKLEVVRGTECLEYYIDPSVSIIKVINHKENLDQKAEESQLYDEQSMMAFIRTTGTRAKLFQYIQPSKPTVDNKQNMAAGSAFKNNINLNEYNKTRVSSYVALYDRSSAVLSVKLRSRTNHEDTYKLYYFDYKYRGRRYKIPINIIKDGIAINKFGLPEKYISLNSYAGKILDYLDQIEIYEGSTYDIYHLADTSGDQERQYAYVGNLYNELWPIPNIKGLSRVAKIPCKPTGPKTQKKKTVNNHQRKTGKSKKASEFNIVPASNSEYEPT